MLPNPFLSHPIEGGWFALTPGGDGNGNAPRARLSSRWVRRLPRRPFQNTTKAVAGDANAGIPVTAKRG